MTDEIIVIGSSSGVPTKRRFSSAYALRVAGGLFLLDCGAPVSTLLYRHNLDPADVQAVFISHWHLDHISGLGLFITQARHIRYSPLTIYGPRGTRGKIRRMLAESFIQLNRIGYELDIVNVKLGKKYKTGFLKFEYFKTQHLERTRYKTSFGQQALACGMVIKGPGWRIVYSGDIASPTDLAPHIGQCDLLISEVTHVSPFAVAEFASAAKVPHVLISHISPKFDETPEKIAEAFAGRYEGQLTIAEDGLQVPLSKP